MRLGRALSAVSLPIKPLISVVFTQGMVFRAIKELFRSEFGEVEPLRLLEYFRFRLVPVVDDSFLSRMPVLRRVSINMFNSGFFLFCFCFLLAVGFLM